MTNKQHWIVFVVLALFAFAAAACGDDDKKTDTDSSTDMTGDMPGDTPVDMPGDTPVDMPVDTPVDMPVDMPGDGDMTMATTCDDYCETVTANCTGANAQYADENACLTACAALPEGMPGDMAGDSVYCRLYHAGAPAQLDPAFHCAHASQAGGGVCEDNAVSGCDRFCANVIENCSGDYEVYADAMACQTACAAFPTTGSFGDDTGDTIQCRDRYAQVSVDDAILCLAASASGGGICVADQTMGQIDRAGRPAISSALVASSHRDLFNAASPADASFFQAEIAFFLGAYDALDGDSTNGLGPALFTDVATLGGALANDVLVVNIASPDCTGGYLAVETGVMGNCGGRTLEQDVIDTTLQALVDASGTTVVTDAIDANDVSFSPDFPYLGAAQ